MGRLEKILVNSSMHARGNIKTLEKLFAAVTPEGVGIFLEIGCGAGAVAAWLNEKCGMSGAGTDVDPDQIAEAKKLHGDDGGPRFIEADATDLPFENGEFDMALIMNVLHHIGGWEKALEETERVLKPGGLFYLCDFVLSPAVASVARRLTKKYAVYTPEELADFCGIGFEPVYSEKPSGALLKNFRAVFRKKA